METLTSAAGLCAQQMKNADDSVNDMEKKELIMHPAAEG